MVRRALRLWWRDVCDAWADYWWPPPPHDGVDTTAMRRGRVVARVRDEHAERGRTRVDLRAAIAAWRAARAGAQPLDA